MIGKITALIVAATCAGLIVFIARGLVREIAAASSERRQIVKRARNRYHRRSLSTFSQRKYLAVARGRLENVGVATARSSIA